MIRGLGIDVVKVIRIGRWMHDPRLLERYFHPIEIERALDRRQDAVLSLAARFAAKEAFGKALGTGLKGLALRDIQVVNDAVGKPELILHGGAINRMAMIGATKAFVSLTHEDDNALAVVVLEG